MSEKWVRLTKKKTLWSQLHSYSECLMVWAQNVIACTVWVNTYTPSDANICAHTHTWAGVETELRGAFQGVDEWGLAKLPRGVQISSIHKQYSGPCGEEGWDEESWRMKKKKKKKFKTRRSREKRKTRSERQLVGKKYVKSSKEERLTQGDKLQRQTEIWNGIQRANFFFSPLSSAAPIRSIRCHSSEWVYGLMDYQRVWHRPFLAQAWSISWQAEGWGASQSRRASSQLSLSTPSRAKHFSHFQFP